MCLKIFLSTFFALPLVGCADNEKKISSLCGSIKIYQKSVKDEVVLKLDEYWRKNIGIQFNIENYHYDDFQCIDGENVLVFLVKTNGLGQHFFCLI